MSVFRSVNLSAVSRTGAIVLLLIGNIVLLAQNRQLKREGVAQAADETVHAGRVLHGLGGVTSDARFSPVKFEQDGRRTLLITYSALCAICDRNKDYWLELDQSLDPAAWRVIWISRDPLRLMQMFAANNGIAANAVLAEVSHRTYAQLSMELVPKTMVIDRRGMVERVWGGSLTTEQRQSIRDYVSQTSNATPPSSGGQPKP